MALGVAITMTIAFCGINAHLRGVSPRRSPVLATCVQAAAACVTVLPHCLGAAKGPQAEQYMKLVASGARAAGVTCVVSQPAAPLACMSAAAASKPCHQCRCQMSSISDVDVQQS